MGLGTLGKVIFFIFLIDMSFYIFAPFIGDENVLAFENDLFHEVVDTDGDISHGELVTNMSSQDLVSTETTGATNILNLFDPLKNTFTFVGKGLKTIGNVLFAPFTLMSSLIGGNIKMPVTIAIIIFAPLAMLIIIGILSMVRGKDL